MIRRPPRSTLLPTRRSSDLKLVRQARQFWQALGDFDPRDVRPDRLERPAVFDRRLGLEVEQVQMARPAVGRSEEHTSELQSRLHLVCRLLLEKKNTHVFTDL